MTAAGMLVHLEMASSRDTLRRTGTQLHPAAFVATPVYYLVYHGPKQLCHPKIGEFGGVRAASVNFVHVCFAEGNALLRETLC